MRLEQVVKEFPNDVAVTWRSFLLRPTPAVRSREKFRAYTESWRNPASQADAGRFRVWSTDEPPPSHSVPPQVAVKAAGRQGAFERYHVAVMDAYFWENRNVTANETLLDVARRVGLDMVRFEADLSDSAVEREVLRDHGDAVQRGIAAVPTVVVDDEWQIPGAQEIAFYRRVVERRRALARGASS